MDNQTPYEYFWSQHFKCRGDEDKLKDCPMGYHQELCQSGLSAAINCDYRNAMTPPQSLLLLGRGQIYSSREGLVAFRINDGLFPQKHVYLCNDGTFYDNEANVACRSVGRNNGGRVVVASQFYKPNQIEFMMTSVSCVGNEHSLLGREDELSTHTDRLFKELYSGCCRSRSLVLLNLFSGIRRFR